MEDLKGFNVYYTILINGATWGADSQDFEAETIEELFEQIKDFMEENETKKMEYLIDYIEDENGDIIEDNFYDWLNTQE